MLPQESLRQLRQRSETDRVVCEKNSLRVVPELAGPTGKGREAASTRFLHVAVVGGFST